MMMIKQVWYKIDARNQKSMSEIAKWPSLRVLALKGFYGSLDCREGFVQEMLLGGRRCPYITSILYDSQGHVTQSCN